jgi:hypothetical protein
VEGGTDLGPHLRTPNPGFNPGFTPHICYIKEGVNLGFNPEFTTRICYIKGVNPRLNPGFGVLRFGLRAIYYQPHSLKK